LATRTDGQPWKFGKIYSQKMLGTVKTILKYLQNMEVKKFRRYLRRKYFFAYNISRRVRALLTNL